MFWLGLIGLIVAGLFIATVIALTFIAWRRKINEKMMAARAKKVVSAEIGALERNCTNRMSLDELNRLENDGYTHVMATMDDSNNIIGDVEIIKDTEHDSQVKYRHGSEGVIVVEN